MRARAWAVALAAVAATLVTARLGWWQVERAQLKRALQAALDERMRLPPLPMAELARGAAEAQAQVHRRAVLRGRWDAAHTVYLDNRPMDGRSGFIVVTPLRLDGDDAVLVQRGWVARDPYDRTRLAPLATPGGEVSVAGRLALPPSALLALGGGAPETSAIRQNLDLAAFARETGLALRPLTLLELDQPGQADGALRRQWPQPAFNVAMHDGYAVQWFALSALILGLYVWTQFIQPWRRRTG